MRADSTSLCNGDASFAVINACYVLTDQYRCILSDLGKEHHLTENEMLVLVHLALYPDARTQKKPVCIISFYFGRFFEELCGFGTKYRVIMNFSEGRMAF